MFSTISNALSFARVNQHRAAVVEQVSYDDGLQEEIEQLLRSRTRQFKLQGKLRNFYQDYSWLYRSRNASAWLGTVASVNLFVILIDYYLDPIMLWPAIVLRGIFIPIVYVVTIQAWRWPRNTHIEGLATTVFVASMMLLASTIGYIAGGIINERYIFACLFVVSTSIALVPLECIWSIVTAVTICGFYLVSQLNNSQVKPLDAALMTLFFGAVIAALVRARWVANISQQRDVLMCFRHAYQVRQLAETNARLNELATTDALTGVLNRRSIYEQLDKAYIADTCHQLALAIVDIDHFKLLNDTFGHSEGDRCLRLVVDGLKSALRAHVDLLGRIGGEEFLLILPNTSEETALAVCERLRAAVEVLGIANPQSPTKPVTTVSIGLAAASFDAMRSGTTEDLVRMADEALYDAKRSGRNRVSDFSRDFAKSLVPAFAGVDRR